MIFPLEGIKVLDLSRNAPGPLCTMILGDYGAEVIKILEAPGARAKSRGTTADIPGASTADFIWKTMERNKRSMFLNLKSSEGKEVFFDLVKRADVVVTEFGVGTAERLGIGYDVLKEHNPAIICCAISGYGQTGPSRKIPGHDLNYIAATGILDRMRDERGKPVMPLNLLADYTGGCMHAALGVLLALVSRSKTGKGQYIDCSMADGVLLSSCGYIDFAYGKGESSEALMQLLSNNAPFYNVYETSDGQYLAVGANEPWFWANLVTAMGHEEFIPLQWDYARWPEIKKTLADLFKSDTRDYWYDKLVQVNTCISKLATLDEIKHESHFKERGSIVDVKYPGHDEVISQVGITLKFSDAKGEIRTAPPIPGEHTEAVLKELGYSDQRIAELHGTDAFF